MEETTASRFGPGAVLAALGLAFVVAAIWAAAAFASGGTSSGSVGTSAPLEGGPPAGFVQDSQGAATDTSTLFTANASVSNRIQALQADGFQVGSDNDVNNNAVAYSYIAWKQETTPTISNIVDQTTNEDIATGAIRSPTVRSSS